MKAIRNELTRVIEMVGSCHESSAESHLLAPGHLTCNNIITVFAPLFTTLICMVICMFDIGASNPPADVSGLLVSSCRPSQPARFVW